MSRTITSALQTNLDAQFGVNLFLVKITLDAGTVFYTDATHDIVWSGDTYKGRSVTRLPSIRESLGKNIARVSLEITGADSTNITTFNEIDYVDRDIIIYFGGYDASAGAVIADPVVAYEGTIERINEVDNPAEEFTIFIEATSPLLRYDDVNGYIAEHSYHQIKYPGDNGFEFVRESQKLLDEAVLGSIKRFTS